jgi:hypothetical protein
MDQMELDRLGAEAVALTHGSPTAFLSGAALTHIISTLLWKPKMPLKKAVLEATEAVKEQFGHQYSQAYDLATLLRHAVTFAENPGVQSTDIMERLGCDNAAKALGILFLKFPDGQTMDRILGHINDHVTIKLEER